jgi:hypothetical protein
MHKNATKCNKTLRKWYKNKHGALKIIDTFEMYQRIIVATTAYASFGLWLLTKQNNVLLMEQLPRTYT